jgi:hypothetical protein
MWNASAPGDDVGGCLQRMTLRHGADLPPPPPRNTLAERATDRCFFGFNPFEHLSETVKQY